jgi:hypothetical protein
MADIADLLGKDLARAAAASSGGLTTVGAQVVDLTDDGGVNIMLAGALLLDVPCADSYRDRVAGDWVAVRQGSQPVVLWRLGADPATGAAADQAVSALTWGTAAPGAGWQSVTQLYVRADASGVGQLYAQLGTVTNPSPPDPGPGSATVGANDAGSWRGGSPDTYHSNPTQGDWTGGGDLRGGWFYGTKIASACSGRTVASMSVTVARRRGSGVNAKRPVHFYLHNFTAAPGGQLTLGDGPQELISLSVGAQGTAALPASWRTALAAGTARGLAIAASGSADYASFTGGTIKITFS